MTCALSCFACVRIQNPKAFRAEMASRFHTYQKAQNNANLSDCMTDLLNIVRRHRVSFNGDVFNVIMTTVVLEGWSCTFG